MEIKKIVNLSLKIIKKIIYLAFLILLLAAHYIYVEFDNISFEQFLYNIINTEGANYSVALAGVKFVFLWLILCMLIMYFLYKFHKNLKLKIYFNIGFKDKIKKYEFFKKGKVTSFVCLILFAFISAYSSVLLLNLDEYITNQKIASKLFEDYYVDGRDVELKFPKKKRNLIYIYTESMETSNASIENGGLMEESYIPGLEELALNNISFSNTDKLGGAIQLNNTNWTIAALISHTAGIPLKLSLIDANSYSGYGNSLPGVYNLGDILEDNGYNNYFMIGSDANFGGRKDYFEYHGNYNIYDYYYAKEDGLISKNYLEFWGYEDKKLFKFARQKILEAAKEDKPFNFTILTVDTHFTDGYMDNSCKEVFDSKYANAIYCSNEKIYSFVKWLEKQDFYDDTTIIITGDHLTMQKNFYNDENYTRTVYNAIINSAVEPLKEKNRLYSTFDMFPTTLAALGVKIEGEKLGLGVNLFSKEKTLVEELGENYLNEEIMKKSFYYDNELLGETFYKMENEAKE